LAKEMAKMLAILIQNTVIYETKKIKTMISRKSANFLCCKEIKIAKKYHNNVQRIFNAKQFYFPIMYTW
jgi:hypothetical protein